MSDITTGPVRHQLRGSRVIDRLLRDRRAMFGAVLVAIVVFLAVAGPALAPHETETFLGKVYQGPGGELLLGADVMGRDVFSRLLHGGAPFLLQGLGAAVFGVGTGILLGIVQAMTLGGAGRVLRFVNDSFLIIPQILVTLVVITVVGATPFTVMFAVGFAQVMYTAKVIRAAGLRVVGEEYFQAARALGMRNTRLLWHEVLPNIAAPALVEFGVRLSVSSMVVASLSYLGFGSASTEWGRMIHDNQGGIAVQPWGTLGPVLLISMFLIGMQLLRDGIGRALSAKAGRA